MQNVKVADAASIGVMIGSLADWLPKGAAALTIIWTVIRIWETDTVQKLLGRRGRRPEDK